MSNQILVVAAELYNQKKFKQSFLKLIEASKKFSHNVEFLELLYKVQIAISDFRIAEKTISILSQKTQSIEHFMNHMNLLMSLGRMNEALDVGIGLEGKALSLKDKKNLFHNLLEIYIVFNDFDGIKDLLQTYQAEFSLEGMYKFAQGILCIQENRQNEAVEFLRQAVLFKPDLDKAWVSLALLHNQMGDTELALANIEKALDINSQNPVAVKCYAIWMEQKGEYRQATGKLNKYLSRNNFDLELTKKHIDLLQKNGQMQQAHHEATKLRYYFGEI